MSTVVKSTLLSLGLLAGVTFAAHAQSASVASLPPTAAAPEGSAPLAPSVAYPGPNPGSGFYGGQVKNEAELAASPKYVGPNPGLGYYGTDSGTGRNAPTVGYSDPTEHPYTANVGPRPN